MARPPLLTEAEIGAALAGLPEWRLVEGRAAIARRFTFPDFRRALAFMVDVGETADRLDHHPDWRNVYNRVEVTLATHEPAGLTRLDMELAAAMDAAARD